jgi:hypothetical protein
MNVIIMPKPKYTQKATDVSHVLCFLNLSSCIDVLTPHCPVYWD